MHKYNDDLYMTTYVDREQNNFDIIYTYNTLYDICIFFLYI